MEVVWSEVRLTDDMEHIILLPSKGNISIWTDRELKFIDPCEAHQ